MATHNIPAVHGAARRMVLQAAHDDAKQMLQNHPDNLLPHLAAKSIHLLVAVLRHNLEELGSDIAAKDRYLVFRAKKKTPIEQIREIYAKNNDLQASDVGLQHPNGIIITVVRAGELDVYGDRIVVIQAVKADRQASQTSSISASSGDFARQPLQEVKRQLTVPSQQSADDVACAKSATPHDSLHGGRPWVNKDGSNFSASPFTQPPAATRSGTSVFPGLEGWSPAQTVTPKQEPLDEAEAQSVHAGGPETEPKREDSPVYEPEMPENPFTMPVEDTHELPTRGTPLRELAQITEPERLEASVKKGVTFLAALGAPLKQLRDSPDAVAFLEQIDTVRNEAVRSRTVVGVVGNTGAGKSSVINAMLEEERLVPTNCMRACTAVVTEISYNHSKVESQKYRAEIEFITQADWQKELTVLYEEVFDEAGRLNQDARNPDSEAGIAYAKMRAVYPKHTIEMLGKASVDKLMREPTVGKVLGTTCKINERVPDAFYQKLQNYVDSKEKTEPKVDKNGHKIGNRKRKFEYWPLIKVVRIFTKADALPTGAVIVDLPGVHDSNAARAAVAAGYLKQCSGLWIVAPITRAVDDKAAQKLLGDTFKRQLKFDGAYSAVTFICSKTDDISRTEAAESLRSQLGEQIAAIDERASAVKRECRQIKEKRTELKNQKSDHDDVFNEVDEKIDAWETLKDRAEDGEVVYPPREKVAAKKRKRAPTTPSSRKKRRGRGGNSSDVEYISSDDEDAAEAQDDGCEAPGADRQPLTSEQIDEKLDELKKHKKDARKAKGTIEEEIRTLNKQLAKLEDEEADLEDQDQQLCIEGRNDYSRTAIKQDFAAGIKDLDMENAEEEDPDNFDPDEDIRDYDEVARSLPVFCVSSRAYQKLCGRLKKDKDVPGFSKPEQTEMPQLQAHCKKLTENGRAATCRRFLNSLARLVSSIALWASDDGTGPKLSMQQHDSEQRYIRRRLEELEKTLHKTIDSAFVDAKETMTDFIYELFPPAVLAASSNAVGTQARWGVHRDLGGLAWATYKATTRRSGVWSGSKGLRDFNDELTAPVLKHLQNNWERTFVRKLPHILQAFAKSGGKVLKDFYTAIAARCHEKGHGLARIGMLAHQLRNYENMFNDASQTTIKHVQDQQRDINREFVPVIQESMQPIYDICAGEAGMGQFKRMKSAMEVYVSNNKDQMFNKACSKVQDQLDAMCATAKDVMLVQTNVVIMSMKRDYMSLVGVDASQIQQVPHGVRKAKLELDEIVSLMDEEFKKVLEAELASLEPEDEPAEGVDHEEDEGMDEDDENEDDDEDEDEEEEDAFEGAEKGEQDEDAMDADDVDVTATGEGAAEPEQIPRTQASEDDEEFHSFV